MMPDTSIHWRIGLHIARGLAYMIDLDDDADRYCRDDNCDLDELHLCHWVPTPCERRALSRAPAALDQPWKIASAEALREATLRAVSAYEPRNFATILNHVQNDYGSCLSRSVHRHLIALRNSGQIVRMGFDRYTRIYAYLRSHSRLVAHPDLVLDQILSLQGIDG